MILPTTAYPPGMTILKVSPFLIPLGNQAAMHSPTSRPKAAPIVNTGMNTPAGTGRVTLTAVIQNWVRDEKADVRDALVSLLLHDDDDCMIYVWHMQYYLVQIVAPTDAIPF